MDETACGLERSKNKQKPIQIQHLRAGQYLRAHHILDTVFNGP